MYCNVQYTRLLQATDSCIYLYFKKKSSSKHNRAETETWHQQTIPGGDHTAILR